MKKIYLIRVYTENSVHSFILVAQTILEAYTEFYQQYKTSNVNFEMICVSDSKYTLEQTLCLLS